MKLILTLISFFVISSARAQVSVGDSSFFCIANWKKGEQKTLLIKRIKKDYESGSLKPGGVFEFEYEAFVTVLDSSKDGYRMQWVFHLPEKFKQANPGLAASMPVYEGLKMVFTTTNSGAFKELLNWEEVKDAYVKMMEISLPPNPDEKQKEAIDKSKDLFNSKEMVEAALVKEILLFHVLYGAFFTTKENTEQTILPSPFSADGIPATIVSKIAEMSLQKDYVKIITDQQIDLAGAGKMMEGIFRKMGLAEDSVMKTVKELLTGFEINDHREYVVTASTGWIVKTFYQRTARTNNMKKVESFAIELKE